MIYNDDFNVAQFCNGTSWVSMSGGASAGAESDPQVGATTNNKWCRGDGSSVVCDLDAPSITETDPEVGPLTSGKWCTTNGTEVQCASDLPIGTLTNGKFCTTNGTTISCTTDAPTATAGADTQVIFNSAGTLTGDASFVWDNTNKRLGIGNTPSAELEVTGTVKSSGPFWSAFGSTGTHRGLLLENIDNTAVAHGVDMAAKLGGTEFQGLSWVKETAWLSGAVAADKDAMLQLGVLLDNAPSVPMVIRADGKVGIGTTAPTNQLEIIGQGTVYADGTGAALFVGDRTNANYSALYRDNNITRLWSSPIGDVLSYTDAGNVGIGTTAPAAALTVNRNASPPASIAIYGSGATYHSTAPDTAPNYSLMDSYASGSAIVFRRANGTNASPAAIASGNRIGSIGWLGYATTGFSGNNAARIGVLAGDDWSDTTQPAHLTFDTKPGNDVGTAPIERMRITADGNVGIGTQGPAYKLTVEGASNYGVVGKSAGTGKAGVEGYHSGSGYWCDIGHSGYAIVCNGPNSGLSDSRLKTHVVPLAPNEGLQAITALKPVHYQWKDARKNTSGPEMGFLAQEVETVLPELVGTVQPSEQAKPSDIQGPIKTLSYERLVVPLVKAVQELKAANDDLAAQLKAANDNQATLQRRLEALVRAQR